MSDSRQRPTTVQSLGPGDESVVLRWVSGEELSDIDLERLRHLLETSELARALLDAVLPNGQRTDEEEHFPEPIGGKPARTRTSLLAFLNKQPPSTRYYFRGARRILESDSPLEALLAYVFAMQERVQRRAIRLLRASDHGRGSEVRKTVVKGVEEERLKRFAAEAELSGFLGSRMPFRVPLEARSVRDDFMHGRKVSASQILAACCVVIEWCTLLDTAVRHSVGQGPTDDLRFKPRTTNAEDISDAQRGAWEGARDDLDAARAACAASVERFHDLAEELDTARADHTLLESVHNLAEELDASRAIYAASIVRLHNLAEKLGAPQPPHDRPSNQKRQDIGSGDRTSKTLRGLDFGAIWSAVRSAGLERSSHDLSAVPDAERELALAAALKITVAPGGRLRSQRPTTLKPRPAGSQLVVVHCKETKLIIEEVREASLDDFVRFARKRLADYASSDCVLILVSKAIQSARGADQAPKLAAIIEECNLKHAMPCSPDRLLELLRRIADVSASRPQEGSLDSRADAQVRLGMFIHRNSPDTLGQAQIRRLNGCLDQMGWLDLTVDPEGPVPADVWDEIRLRLDAVRAGSNARSFLISQLQQLGSGLT